MEGQDRYTLADYYADFTTNAILVWLQNDNTRNHFAMLLGKPTPVAAEHIAAMHLVLQVRGVLC